jgi:NAD(P)-dependent dehydrogenase (short-subunit alcohol dehydrogenase family)
MLDRQYMGLPRGPLPPFPYPGPAIFKDTVMQLGLKDKVAVVTGASKGIGLAIAEGLASEGAHVCAGARSQTPELDALTSSSSVTAALVDLGTPEGPRSLVDEAVAGYGRVDILINNVGAVRPRLHGFLQISDDEWEWTLNINLLAAVRATRAALPHLLQQPHSTIVTVGSVNARLPDPGVVDYSAAKAALGNFCKALSKEFGARGLRVNTISPGPVETAMWLGSDGVADAVAQATGAEPDDVTRAAVARTATGRFSYAQEVADLAILLASGRAGNVTGSDFVIDGGIVETL